MTPTLTSTTTAAPPTAADRCDRCSAQAKMRIVLPGGGDLVFCGHHAHQYEDRIKAVAVQVAEAGEQPPSS